MSVDQQEQDVGVAAGAVWAITTETVRTYITAGKSYAVCFEDPARGGFEVVDDEGDKIYCLWVGCPHLRGGHWQRVTSADAPTPSPTLPGKAS